MSQNPPCPYQVLGVERSADDATIKSAYRKLALATHPDRVRGAAIDAGKTQAQANAAADAALAKSKDINVAYDLLKDPQKRAAYDRYGHGGFGGFGGASRRPGSSHGAGARSTGGYRDPFEDIFKKAGMGDKDFEDWFRNEFSKGRGARPGAGNQQQRQQQQSSEQPRRPNTEQPRGARPNASSGSNAGRASSSGSSQQGRSWREEFRSRSNPPRSTHASSDMGSIFHNEHGKLSFGRVAAAAVGVAVLTYVVHKIVQEEQGQDLRQANFNALADLINLSANQGVAGR